MGSGMLCTCSGEGSGDWIACDSEACPVERYHWACVGITKAPVGDWVCPLCRRGTTASVRLEEQATDHKKVRPKRRKSQRITRIVYETTEASIFEHIIEESRAKALAIKEEAKKQVVAGTTSLEGYKGEPEEESAEGELVRKLRTKVERELGEEPDGMEVDAGAIRSQRTFSLFPSTKPLHDSCF